MYPPQNLGAKLVYLYIKKNRSMKRNIVVNPMADPQLFRLIVSALQYATVTTRPEIGFDVNKVSQMNIGKQSNRFSDISKGHLTMVFCYNLAILTLFSHTHTDIANAGTQHRIHANNEKLFSAYIDG